VHDARGVRFCQRLDRLQHELDRLEQRQATEPPQLLGDVVSFQKLHHHVRQSGVERADVEHARHVLAANLGCGARLAPEAFGGVWSLGGGLAQKLDRDALL